jgi:DNA (cytosine-5)-methyltransferase 1
MIKKTKKKEFTFIDLFAGIGGFHLALHDLGGKCVFVNEFNKFSRQTYEKNFSKIEPELFLNKKNEPYFWESIKKITLSDTDLPRNVWTKNIRMVIPKFDILCGGFPCQPFSGIGKRRGFDDDRGTLFNDIERIIEARKPKVVFLENVRNIVAHNGGKTFEYILDRLDKIGYYVNKERDDSWNILKASEFGLPTSRARFYLVAFRKNTRGTGKFRFPKPTTPEGMTLRKFFKDDNWPDRVGRTIRVGGKGSPVYPIGNGKWFIDKRSWDTYIVDNKKHVLTVDEAKKMMGFPKKFIFPVNSNQSFRQLGNSVAVNVIREIGKEIIALL